MERTSSKPARNTRYRSQKPRKRSSPAHGAASAPNWIAPASRNGVATSESLLETLDLLLMLIYVIIVTIVHLLDDFSLVLPHFRSHTGSILPFEPTF